MVTAATKPDNSREEILRVAARLFRARGYRASTLRKIAEAAGIKSGSIYYHFNSKDEILEEILNQGLRDIYDGVREVIGPNEDGVDHRARINDAIHTHLGLLLIHSEFTAANIRLYNQLPVNIRERQRSLRRSYAKLWDTLLKDAQQAGLLRPDIRIGLLRQFLLGALNWTVEWFDAEKHSVDILGDNCSKMILDGISSGLLTKTGKSTKSAAPIRGGSVVTEKKSERTRDDILKAAAVLFGNLGYAASTLRGVGAVAGKKAASIYYYFGSKDEILDVILDEGVRALFDGVQASIDNHGNIDNFRSKIACAVHAHLMVLLATDEYTSAYTHIYSQLPKDIRDRHLPRRRAYVELWETLLRNAQQAGQLRSDIEIVILREFLLGALNRTVEWFDEDRHSADAIAVRCTKLIFDGICVKKNSEEKSL